MKITHSKDEIRVFGGLNFCHDLLETSGVYKLIDNHLGKRCKAKGVNYSDIFANYFAIFLNGRDCSEDVNEHLRGSFKKRYAAQVLF